MKEGLDMGWYSEQGKNFEIFMPDYIYKVILLFGHVHSYYDDENDTEQLEITYFLKSHNKTYRIRKTDDNEFIFGNHVITELDVESFDDITGIGIDVEITVDDLDAMFNDWEKFAKNRLRPVNESTLNNLCEVAPHLFDE